MDRPSRSPLSKRLPALTEDENLGRSVYSRSRAKKARKLQPIPEVFLVSRADDKISVDRMDHADRTRMARIAVRRGHERSDGPKEFQGWAVLTVGDACGDGRSVTESPLDDNPYHADICMNLSCGDKHRDERRMMQKQHSLELALKAVWEEAP